MIKGQEADCICKLLLCEASEKLRGRLRKASDRRRSQHARHEIPLCNNQCRYVDDRGDQSHCRCRIANGCGGNNRRPSYGASKRYRSKRPALDGYCPHNNQPREQKSSAGHKKTATSVLWYIVSQEVMTMKVDCNEGCEITPRNNQQNIFHRIARTQAISRHSIARRTTMVVFFTSHCVERVTITTFFRLIVRERAN